MDAAPSGSKFCRGWLLGIRHLHAPRFRHDLFVFNANAELRMHEFASSACAAGHQEFSA